MPVKLLRSHHDLTDNLSDDQDDDDDDNDEKTEIARSSYAGMLHDVERHRKYYDALRETVIELRADGCERITTLDIGTGTGILAMMAAKAGSDHVVACEIFEPVSKLARDVIASNNLSSKITVVNKLSNDLTVPTDLPCKADVLVTEIFDSELLGEGVLPTLRDAHQRLTSSNVKTIPSAAVVNLQLFQSSHLWEMNKLRVEKDAVKLLLPDVFEQCSCTASTYELQISHLSNQPNNLQLLSDPFPITKLDFTQPFQHTCPTTKPSKGPSYSMAEATVAITSAGTLHGVVLWWDLVLHAKKNIVLSMQPCWLTQQNNNYIWRDHWMQCVYYLQKPLTVAIGDRLTVRMFYDDYSVWFDVDFVKHPSNPTIPRPLCKCGLHVTWPRERFALWNDCTYIELWKSLFCERKTRDILLVGETSLLPLVIAGNNSVNVSYLEYSGWSSKRVIEELVSFNHIDNIRHVSMDELETESKYYDAIIVDPIWSSSILPWHHLKTWRLLTELRQQDGMKVSTKAYPSIAYLKACVVRLSELWKVEAPVVDIEGFNFTKFDLFMEEARSPIRIGSYGMFYSAAPYAMMEYENEVISDVVILATFDFDMVHPSVTRVFTEDIHCRETVDKTSALVTWLDFQLDDTHSITTGLTEQQVWVKHSKQGVVFIPKEIHEKQINMLKCALLYEPDTEDVVFRFL